VAQRRLVAIVFDRSESGAKLGKVRVFTEQLVTSCGGVGEHGKQERHVKRLESVQHQLPHHGSIGLGELLDAALIRHLQHQIGQVCIEREVETAKLLLLRVKNQPPCAGHALVHVATVDAVLNQPTLTVLERPTLTQHCFEGLCKDAGVDVAAVGKSRHGDGCALRVDDVDPGPV